MCDQNRVKTSEELLKAKNSEEEATFKIKSLTIIERKIHGERAATVAEVI